MISPVDIGCVDLQRPSKEPRSIRMPKSQHANYAELRHGPEFVDNLRRGHPASRQNTIGEPRSPKVELNRTGSLQQSSSEVRRWNVNAGAPNERLTYQPFTMANQAPVYSHDIVAARHGGSDLNQSLPATQPGPTRAASMRHTETRYQASPADGNMLPGVGLHPPGPPLSVSNMSYLSNSSPATSAMDVLRPGVPVSSATQQVTADQHKPVRDSFDLPAPPTPPSSTVVPSSLSGDHLPSPPSMITPPPVADSHFSALQLQQYLPAPEPVTSAAATDTANQPAAWHTSDLSNVTSAAIDNNSDSSSLLTAQQTEDTPLVRDTRSDLLAAIREGMFWYFLPETCVLCLAFVTLIMSVIF